MQLLSAMSLPVEYLSNAANAVGRTAYAPRCEANAISAAGDGTLTPAVSAHDAGMN